MLIYIYEAVRSESSAIEGIGHGSSQWRAIADAMASERHFINRIPSVAVHYNRRDLNEAGKRRQHPASVCSNDRLKGIAVGLLIPTSSPLAKCGRYEGFKVFSFSRQ